MGWAMGATAKYPILWRKIQRNLEDYGWSVTARKSLERLFRWVCLHRTYRIYGINLEITQPDGQFDPRDFTFKILGPEDKHAIE